MNILGPALQGLVSETRYVYIAFNVQGMDATVDFNASLVSFTYREGIEVGKEPANTAAVVLADPESLIRTKYRMAAGQTVGITLNSFNWNYPGEKLSRPLGYMEIKTYGVRQDKQSGTVVEFSLTTIPTTSDVRLTKASKAYENTTLKAIAQDVANTNHLKLQFMAPDQPESRADEHNHSDMKLLQKLGTQHDYLVRTENGTLYVQSYSQLEQSAPQHTLVCPTPGNVGGIDNKGGVTHWAFKEALEDAYSQSQVAIKDNRTGKTVAATAKKAASATTNPGTGPKLILNSGYTDPDFAVQPFNVSTQLTLTPGQ
jgi:hypothetical protein